MINNQFLHRCEGQKTRPQIRPASRQALGLTTTALGCLVAILTLSTPAQNITQSMTLQNGWNAVYLEVGPPHSSPEAVFTNLPVQSVWTRAESVSSAQFIQDASEDSFNEAQWLRWAPSEPPFVNSLRSVVGGHIYLVKLTNGPAVWQVAGEPVARSTTWTPDLYNLRSFPIDPGSPPTFKQFFGSSTAHYDTTQDRPRGIYRLSNTGQWIAVNKNDPMATGAAYWVYCLGASSFTGPLDLHVDSGQSLAFGSELDRITLQFENLSSGVRTVTLRQLETPFPGLLAYQRFNATNGFEWANLSNPFTLTVTNGSQRSFTLAVRRSQFPGSTYATVMEIADGQGTRYRLPLTAERLGQGYAGLWMGSVSVNAISEPHFGSLITNLYAMVNGTPTPLDAPGLIVATNVVVTTNADLVISTNEMLVVRTTGGVAVPVYEKVERTTTTPAPTPTKSEFTMRLLIHVDTDNQARLLKEVVQLWRNGTYTNDAQGFQRVDKPGAYVLITRDNLLSQFQGAVLRDGVSVGRRLSAIGFDFDGQGTNHLVLSGSFAPGQSLTGEIQIKPDYPINPFRHKYHPDHDNLNSEFNPIGDSASQECYLVTRELEFEFPSAGTTSATELDSGYSVVAGVYRETLTGLHKQPIQVQGTFRLSRASYIAELNPSPTP